MNSWWELGEGSGYHGSDLAVYQVTCPFCMEKGNFSTAHEATKKQPNASKVLHFDTLKCGNCAGYVMVFWSASTMGDNHDFRVLPWAIRLEKHPGHWPEDVGRFWLQAHRSATDENWDAAAVMTRSALQLALRQHGAEGGSLKQEIDNLTSKCILPSHMNEWAHELREFGNEAAHPAASSSAAHAKDVRDALTFLDFLLRYLYTLPHEIKEYRSRKKSSAS